MGNILHCMHQDIVAGNINKTGFKTFIRKKGDISRIHYGYSICNEAIRINIRFYRANSYTPGTN